MLNRQLTPTNRCFSLLLRRFVFRMAEASAKRVTGDEPQGTMGRVQTAVSFPPSFARTFLERRLGTRQSLFVYNVYNSRRTADVFPVVASVSGPPITSANPSGKTISVIFGGREATAGTRPCA